MAVDRTPGDFGSTLREARERRGVSLRQIANATKITIGALEALERNDISRLPGGIFSRAFVRSYAVEVGLDPEKTIHDFIAQFPQDFVTAGHRASDRTEDHDVVESDRWMATTFLRLVLVSVPIAGVVVYFGIAGRPAAPAVVQPAAQAVETLPEMPPPPPHAAVDESAAIAPDETLADRLTVTLSVSRPCWVDAIADSERVIARVMQAGEQRTVEVRRELVLRAGDAAAMTMTLNGAEAKPLGRSGEVVITRLNLANFKDFLTVR